MQQEPSVMPPSVTVTVSLYNKEEQVLRAVNSVLMQSFEDYALVVVDDGSTDGGPGLVEAISDQRITLIRQPNGGPGHARNQGATHTPSDILAFLDADDEWFPGYLEHSVSMLASHPECGAVIQGHVKGVERQTRNDLFEVFGTKRGVWRMPTDLAGADVKRAVNACHTSSVVCRRSVFESYGGFYDKDGCRFGEDAYIWLQVLLNHDVYVDAHPRSWYHTEDSGLYWNLRSVVPAEPALLDPQKLWDNCPTAYRDTLQRYLDFQAETTVRRLTKGGDFTGASTIISSSQLWPWSLIDKARAGLILYSPKNRMRWRLPRLFRALNRVRQMLSRS